MQQKEVHGASQQKRLGKGSSERSIVDKGPSTKFADRPKSKNVGISIKEPASQSPTPFQSDKSKRVGKMKVRESEDVPALTQAYTEP